MPTIPELVTVWVVVVFVVELDPPQPMLKAVAANNIKLSPTAGQSPREASFLRKKNSGSSRKGSRISAEDVLATVSAKTTVTWYVPDGVVEEVEIVNTPVAKE
jgi:hypothetical protein